MEIGCGGDLPNTIEVDIEDMGMIEVLVEYPWTPIACSKCKKNLDIGIKVVQKVSTFGFQNTQLSKIPIRYKHLRRTVRKKNLM